MSTSPFSLDAVRLAFECPMRWEKLARVASGQHPNGADDTKRFCHACDKHVYNLSAMTRSEAEALVREDAPPICVRIEVDAAGRSIHRPSRSTVLAGAVLAAGLAGCVPSADSDSSGSGVAVGQEAVAAPPSIAELGYPDAVEVAGQARVTDAPPSSAGTIPELGTTPPAAVVDEPRVLMGEPPAVVTPPPSIMGGIRPVEAAPLGRVRRE